MWQKLKKIDWIENIDLVLLAFVVIMLAVSYLNGGIDAEAKIREFNTITHTWADTKP